MFVGYSTYMCQFSFNIKAPLFVCSSLALNLLTTHLVLLLPVDLASFPNSFSRPFRLGPSLSNSRLSSFARFAPYKYRALACCYSCISQNHVRVVRELKVF